MMQYQRNNIVFRIAASAAICKFKNLQTLSFIQLARKELNFDIAAREVVLLTFDRFSQWIYRVERICLSTPNNDTSVHLLVNTLKTSFIDEYRIIQTVVESHPDVFTPIVAKYLRVIHEYTVHIIDDKFDNLENKHTNDLFTDIVDIVSDYLQHILVALHEFNNNCITHAEKPFISMVLFYKLDDKFKYVPCLERLKFFNKYEGSQNFVFKHYCSSDAELHFENLTKECRPLNITLDRETHTEQEEYV